MKRNRLGDIKVGLGSFLVTLCLLLTILFPVLDPRFRGPVVAAGENWYNNDWGYRKLITINESKVGATLTNFPVLIYRSADTDLAADAQDDGDDICFVKYSDNTTKLNHEIESFNGTTGRLNAWVNITSLSSSVDTKLWMYYGHADVESQENVAGTWNANYVMVFHFEEATGNYQDSTSYNNDGAPSAGVDMVAHSPKIGTNCPEFDGASNNDYIMVHDNPSINFSATLTWEGWVNSDTVSAEGSLISKETNGHAWALEHYYTSSPARVLAQNGEGGATLRYSTTGFVANAWQYRAASFDDTNVYFYYNGSSDGSGTFVIDGTVQKNLYIGCKYPASAYLYEFDGTFDEFRLSNIVRNSSWLKASYNTSGNPLSFHYFGAEEEKSAGWSNSNPVNSVPGPANGATGIQLTIHSLNITVNDLNDANQSMNITFRTNASGTWKTAQTNASISNGTYRCLNVSWVDENSMKYWWNVSTNDGCGGWDNDTYYFTTVEAAKVIKPQYRLITINHSQVNTPLVNFPVLVKLSADTNLSYHAQSDSDDIQFWSYDNSTQYHHEIESYDGAGTLYAWVNITSVSSSADTYFWMKYGNETMTNQENVPGTWDSDYSSVHHFNSTSGSFYDSTSYNNDSKATAGLTYSASGVSGVCPEWDGTDSDYIQFTNFSCGRQETTIEVWVNPDTWTETRTIYDEFDRATNPFWEYTLSMDINSNGFMTRHGTYNNSARNNDIYFSQALSTGDWHHVVLWYSVSNSNKRLYVDGSVDASTATNTSLPITPATGRDVRSSRLGWASDTTYLDFDGKMDEFRVSKIARNTSWLNATYHTISDDEFLVFGDAAEEPAVTVPVVTTNATTDITNVSAKLWGYLQDDGGEDNTVWFEWDNYNLSEECAGFIATGNVVADGRSILWKNRHGSGTYQKPQFFDGTNYSYIAIGITTDGCRMGQNEKGLVVANYDISGTIINWKYTTDKSYDEDESMHHVLGNYSTVADAAYFLATHANFNCQYAIISSEEGVGALVSIDIANSHSNITWVNNTWKAIINARQCDGQREDPKQARIEYLANRVLSGNGLDVDEPTKFSVRDVLLMAKDINSSDDTVGYYASEPAPGVYTGTYSYGVIVTSTSQSAIVALSGNDSYDGALNLMWQQMGLSQQVGIFLPVSASYVDSNNDILFNITSGNGVAGITVDEKQEYAYDGAFDRGKVHEIWNYTRPAENMTVDEYETLMETIMTCANSSEAQERMRSYCNDTASTALLAYEGNSTWYSTNESGSSGVSSGEAFSDTITGLLPGTVYFYRAWANNSLYTVNGSTMRFMTLPNKPNSSSCDVVGTNYINISWHKGQGAHYTVIERNTSESWTRGEGTEIYNGTGNYYNNTGLNHGTQYYYQLWSFTVAEGLFQYSSVNESISETTSGAWHTIQTITGLIQNNTSFKTTQTISGSLQTYTTPPSITINFAGNPGEKGGPYYIPPAESGTAASDGYYANDSYQSENFIYINATVTDAIGLPTSNAVRLDWYSQTTNTWDNTSYFTKKGAYYEYNKTGVTAGKYSFNIYAVDNASNTNITRWNKTGPGGVYIRRYVHLASTPTNISYKPLYLYNGGTWDTYTYDRLPKDQGSDGNPIDTGLLNSSVPGDDIQYRWCVSYAGAWFNNNSCILPFSLTNMYFHVWFKTSNYAATIGWYKTNGIVGATQTNYYTQSSASRSNVTSTMPSSMVYHLSTNKLATTSTAFTDNNIYELLFNLVASGGNTPRIVSNRSYTSFIMLNVPSNTTLNSTDWTSQGGLMGDRDGDGLSDYTELYVRYTNPFLSDTDNDGQTDVNEVSHGSDPNNYTSKYSLTTAWYSIQTISGAISNTTKWVTKQTVQGELQNSTGFKTTQTIQGALQNTTGFKTIQTLSGVIQNTTGFKTVQTIGGTIQNVSVLHWYTIQTVSGLLQNLTGFKTCQTLQGMIQNITGFKLVQTLQGAIQNSTGFKTIQILTGELQNTSSVASIGEYLIITDSSLYPGFANFTSWKQWQGYNVTIVNTTDFVSNSSFWATGYWGDVNEANPWMTGYETVSNFDLFNDTQAIIRNYIRYQVYNNSVDYVLIGGDRTLVPVRSSILRDDTIDETYIQSYYYLLNGTLNPDENIEWGVDVDTDEHWWDYDDVGIDYDSDVILGTIPSNSIEDIENYTAKAQVYCNLTDNLWNVTLLASALTSPTVVNSMIDTENYLDEGYTQSVTYASGLEHDNTKFSNRINNGTNLVLFDGFSHYDRLCYFYDSSTDYSPYDYLNLENSNYPFVFLGEGCLFGADTSNSDMLHHDSVSSTLMNRRNGSVAIIGDDIRTMTSVTANLYQVGKYIHNIIHHNMTFAEAQQNSFGDYSWTAMGYLNDNYSQMIGFKYYGDPSLTINYNVQEQNPVVYDEQPTNASVNIGANERLSAYVGDWEGDTLNVYFYTNATGSWGLFGSNLSVGNGTYYQDNDSMVDDEVTYWWSVNVSDGTTWTNETYHYTVTVNQAPIFSNFIPAQNSVDVSLNQETIQLDMNDREGDDNLWTIETSPHIGNSTIPYYILGTNGTICCPITGMVAGVVYTVYVNATSVGCFYWNNISYTLTFTNLTDLFQYQKPIINSVSPTDGSSGVSFNPNLHVNVEEPVGYRNANVTFRTNSSGAWQTIDYNDTSKSYSTLLLRPDGNSSNPEAAAYELGNTPSVGGYLWQSLSDQNDSTYVNFSDAFEIRSVSISNHTTQTGHINSVTFYARSKSYPDDAYMVCRPKHGIGLTLGNLWHNSILSDNSSTTTTNPYTLLPWTWKSIDDLELAVMGDTKTNFTEIWMVVNYSSNSSQLISQPTTDMNVYNTKYWWSVNTTDGYEWNNQTYSFTTKGPIPYGLIGDANVSWYEYDKQEGRQPVVCRVNNSEYYLIAECGDASSDYDGFVRTIQVDNDTGIITQSVISSYEYGRYDGYYPSICHIPGTDKYVIASRANASTAVNDRVRVVTIQVYDSNGTIRQKIFDEQLLTYDGMYINMTRVSPADLTRTGYVYAIAYSEQATSSTSTAPNDGWMQTIWVNKTGTINNTILSSREFDTADGLYPRLIMVDSDTIAICYVTTSSDGYVSTWNITASGAIGATRSSYWEYDTSNGQYPGFIKVGTNTFAVAYRDTDTYGYVKTFAISNTGAITKSFIDTLTFTGTMTNLYNYIFPVNNGSVYGITFQGLNGDGYVYTMNISNAGAIGNGVIDTLDFDMDNQFTAPVVYVNKSYYLIVFQGNGYDGHTATISIVTNYGTPTFTSPYPVNESVDVDTVPRCEITLNDLNGDAINLYWYENTTGDWVLRQTNTSCANSTYRWMYSQATETVTKYWWTVYANDTLHNSSAWYCFTTKSESAWRTVQTISGSLVNTTRWRTVQTVSGAIQNVSVSEWNTIQTINGDIKNTTNWKTVLSIMGSIVNSTGFKTAQTLTGVVLNVTRWMTAQTVDGVILNTTGWRTTQTVSGIIQNISVLNWHTIQTISGGIQNTTGFKTTQTINGLIQNTTGFRTTQTVSGAIQNLTGFRTVQTINGAIFNISGFRTIQTISGAILNTTAFKTTQTLAGAILNSTGFKTVQTINGEIINTTAWRTTQTTDGLIQNISVTHWYTIQTLTGIIQNTTGFKTIQTIQGSIMNTTGFRTTQTIQGSITNATGFRTIQTINGIISNISGFKTIQTVQGLILNSTGFKTIQTIGGAIQNISIPVVVTNLESGTTKTNTTLHGTLVDDGGGIHVHVGFEWGTTTSYGNLSQLPPIYVYAAGFTTQKIYQYWVSNMTKIRESADYGGGIYDMIADDNYVYAAGDGTEQVYQYWASNLTFRANTSDYGGIITSIIADEYYVYAAGYTTQTVRQYWKTNMTMKAESIDYGGTINAITEDEFYVYIGGTTTQKVYQLWKSNLTKRMETPDYGGTIWSVIVSMNGTVWGNYIYVGGATTQTVRKYWKSNGTFVGETADYGGQIRALAQDDTHIYAGGATTNKVYRYWKSNLTKQSETVSYGGQIWEIASDSTCPYIYVGGAGTMKVYQFWMSNMTKKGESISYGGNIRTVTTYPHDYPSGADFETNLTGLVPCTTYHYRAYALNEFGGSYGIDRDFTTTCVSWETIQTVNGLIQNITGFRTTQMITGLITNSTNWYTAQTVSGAISNTTGWRTTQTLDGSIQNTSVSKWSTIQETSGLLQNTTVWKMTQMTSGTIQNISGFKTTQTIQGTILNSTKWSTTQALNGSIQNISINITMSNPYPVNGSTGVERPPTCAITINNLNGENMTLNWYEDTTGPWVLQHTDYNCTNGTYNWVYTNATAYSHLYYWMVIANDTTSNTSRIYHFTTEAYVPPVNHPPNTPSNPDPSNHATGVDIDKNMSWTGGDPDGDAVTYDVYFNNSVTLVKVSSNQSGLTYDPGTMTYSETYYWRIVAWDSHGERTTGPVWDFTIMATPWTTVETINGSIRNVTYGVQIINIYPGNNSHIQKTQPTLLFTLFNSTGVSNFTVFTGNSTANATYFLFNDSYVGNGTYHSSYFNATEYYTDYYWRVCVWDNGAWLNETYSFNIIHESGGGSQGNVAFGILGIFGIFGLVGFIMVLRMRKRKKGNGET